VPAYDPEKIGEEFDYIATKLGISSDELRQYFVMPKKFYWDYRNQERIIRCGAEIMKALGLGRAGAR